MLIFFNLSERQKKLHLIILKIKPQLQHIKILCCLYIDQKFFWPW
jgi:hypothetical protein